MPENKVREYFSPKRTALSLKYPFLASPILFTRRAFRKVATKINPSISFKRDRKLFKYITTRHSSPLIRKLGNSDIRLQKQKVINLKLASELLDGVIIPPGKTFSLWDALGNPTSKRGFAKGMLISNGKVLEGVGGGLCQLSNLLHWAFLHTPLIITERSHHSRDVFPDHNRTLPFGSGATIFYNLIDLRVKNTLSTAIQIHLWVDENNLRVQLRSPEIIPEKFHVYEKNHLFIQTRGTWFRMNEIWRETLITGIKQKDEKLYENFAPVIYPVTNEYLSANAFSHIML